MISLLILTFCIKLFAGINIHYQKYNETLSQNNPKPITISSLATKYIEIQFFTAISLLDISVERKSSM